jgi:hypothetical protein
MKYLIVLSIAATIAMYGCGNSASAATVSSAKTSVSSGEFRGSDHMPPEAVAAKKRAGY